MLEKAYCMTLVVIVGAYSAFVNKASIRRIDEANIVAQFENGMTLVFSYCGCLQRLLAK